MRRALVLFTVGCFFAGSSQAQEHQRGYPPELAGAEVEIYKVAGDVALRMFVFYPEKHQPTDRRPAIVFFFGGGWTSGNPDQFYQHCKYLASRGMVAMTADYRVSSRHGTKVVDCVADGKSAIRWVRTNANRLGVDPQKIVAGGGSAGGHVAACTGVIQGFEETDDSSSVSSVPNALVLFNPALALAPIKGRAPFDEKRIERLRQRVGDDPIGVSPFHHVNKGDPPTIIFHGKSDTTVAYWTAEAFCEAMQAAGNRCELRGFAGQSHGFFNFGRGDGTSYRATVRAMDEFLASLGFLNGEPTIDVTAR